MKKAISKSTILFTIVLILFSCNKKTNDETNGSLSFYAEKYFKLNLFTAQFGNEIKPDFKKSTELDLLYESVPEKYIVTPVTYANGVLYGKLYTLKFNDTIFRSIVVKINEYDIESGKGIISYIGVGTDNAINFEINNHKITNFTELLTQTDGTIKSNSTGINSTSSCTGGCYKQAKDACDADPDCKILCDNLPSCSGSIAVACFMHCIFK